MPTGQLVQTLVDGFLYCPGAVQFPVNLQTHCKLNKSQKTKWTFIIIKLCIFYKKLWNPDCTNAKSVSESVFVMKVSTYWLYMRLHQWLARLPWWTQQDTSDMWSESEQFCLCSSPAHNQCSPSPPVGTGHRTDNPLFKDRITLKSYESGTEFENFWTEQTIVYGDEHSEITGMWF